MKLRVMFFLALLSLSFVAFSSTQATPNLPFTAGHIDSPFVVQDGSAIYFMHSPAFPNRWFNGDIIQWIEEEESTPADPDTIPLTGHISAESPLWWMPDIYVSYAQEGGTWSCPKNVGEPINTVQSECCMWVNDTQTTMIFSRPSFVVETNGTFISHRESVDDAWGTLERLPGDMGDMAESDFTNFHFVPSGNLYFEKEGENRTLYYALQLEPMVWDMPQPFPEAFQSTVEDTQIWVNDAETELFYNRRDESGETSLLYSHRDSANAEWSAPEAVTLQDFEDENGLLLWGEPSFTADGTMFFLRIDSTDLTSELFSAPRNTDGSFGPPQRLEFETCEK